MVLSQKILYFFMGKMIKLISQKGKVRAAKVLFGKFQVNAIFGWIWIFQCPGAVCKVFGKHFTYRIGSINDSLHQSGTPEVLGSIKSKHNQEIGGKYINQQVTNSLHPMSFGLPLRKLREALDLRHQNRHTSQQQWWRDSPSVPITVAHFSPRFSFKY